MNEKRRTYVKLPGSEKGSRRYIKLRHRPSHTHLLRGTISIQLADTLKCGTTARVPELTDSPSDTAPTRRKEGRAAEWAWVTATPIRDGIVQLIIRCLDDVTAYCCASYCAQYDCANCQTGVAPNRKPQHTAGPFLFFLSGAPPRHTTFLAMKDISLSSSGHRVEEPTEQPLIHADMDRPRPPPPCKSLLHYASLLRRFFQHSSGAVPHVVL